MILHFQLDILAAGADVSIFPESGFPSFYS